ncbi:MAG: L,D-transpeptidase family protein [Bacteroidota bacterium]|nr:L,D-transpeptidase family protein [Bacteroidota bacterium]
MQNRLNRILFLIFIALFTSGSTNIYAEDSLEIFPKYDSVITNERLYFETENVEASDDIIRQHLVEQFSIISESEVNKILLSKVIRQNSSENFDKSTDSTLSSASEPVYKVSFEVPQNYLADTAKILWELNIPNFESKIYQLYNGKQIYIDTWPNVVGTIKTKTYTGNFQAYKIRNWPFYKDPEPSKAHLPPTKPGTENPLGLFVVHYDENSLRYFHGTNTNNLLQSKMRNLSHGCVRNDNDNIAKMKEFIIKRVVKSEDLSSWLDSKKTLIYDFEEQDKFPVKIIYKTYDINKDLSGNYIILYKDIYNYNNSGRIDTELNDLGLITLTNKANLISEYREKIGNDISDDALEIIIDYLINNGEKYEKYYINDLKEKFMIQN